MEARKAKPSLSESRFLASKTGMTVTGLGPWETAIKEFRNAHKTRLSRPNGGTG